MNLPISNNHLIGNDIPKLKGKVSEEENRPKISIASATREKSSRLFT